MELQQKYEDAAIHLQRQLDETLNAAGYWRKAYEVLLQDFHHACDERADAKARVLELEFHIERDKDGDGFISKDAMDLLFPVD